MSTDKIMIIDGGVGTEISRRGIPLHPCYWSAAAHITHPDIVLEIHQDFIHAGADIISANTFMAGRHILAAGGLNEFEEINKQAIDIAKEARHLSGDDKLIIAGTLSTLPPLNQADDIPRGKQIEENFRDQANLLAESGADILLVEALFDSESAASMIAACCETGLPVWVGLSATVVPDSEILMTFRQPGTLEKLPHETFDNLLETVIDFPIDVLGVMHTDTSLMPAALTALLQVWKGRKMAYPKTGLATRHDWEFCDLIEESDYTALMAKWVKDYSLTIVGGCCGMSPGHISTLSNKLRGFL